MASQTQPHQEPIRVTLLRTGIIALGVGVFLSLGSGGLLHWPLASILAFWPAFGGHWVEVVFLNWLRPRLPSTRFAQLRARVGIWFIGGIGLAIGMRLTAALAGFRPARWPAVWVAGLGFIGLELGVHLALQIRGRPSFYNGRG